MDAFVAAWCLIGITIVAVVKAFDALDFLR
jgi:hypothetical protein